jgi:hypothetical protein
VDISGTVTQPSEKRVVLKGRKKLIFYSIYFTILAALLFSAAEVAVRIKGYRPWEKPAFQPLERREYYMADPLLGFRLRPGEFTIKYPNSSFSFRVTHAPDGNRITHPLREDSAEASQKKEIWIFGCSFTHGYSLNDEETYAWRLQEGLPRHEVVNFGVDGYGTVQSLIQFREALKRREKPEVVVIAYGSFHDERNAALRSWRKWNTPGDVMPYARLGWDGQLHYYTEPMRFYELPLMRYSAFVHFLEKSYNRQEGRFQQSHEISRRVIKEFSELCRKNGITMVVAGLYTDAATTDMLDYSKREGIPATDMSVDLNVKENTNLPYDHHPSALANSVYAQKLESFLSTEVLKKEPSGLKP